MKVKTGYKKLQIIVALIFTFNTVFSQKADHGLIVIKNIRAYHLSIKDKIEKDIIDVKTAIPNISLDLRYATSNNFMHQKLYESRITTTYLRLAAAHPLIQIQKELNEKKLGLKIFDAYRPYSVTEKMWQLIKDERYVANPKNGSGHNRGIAVDVTIINLKTKEELPMGTGFDNFSDTAHQTFTALPKEILHNRNFLKTIMEKYGFKSLETEWWHYSLPNANEFEVLDLSFKKLKRIID